MNNYTKCPNYCDHGKIKSYLKNDRALFNLVNCPFCKGKGIVTKEEESKINLIL